jgi:transposase
MDLRSRAIGAVESGKSCRASAEQFCVAPSTVIRWRSLQKETGSFEAGRRGRRTGSVLDGHRDLVLSIYEAGEDATLMEMCAALAQRGIFITKSSLDRLFVRHDFSRKKRLATR